MKNSYTITPASLARSDVWRNHRARGSDGSLTEVLARPGTHIVCSHRGYLLVSSGGLHRFSVSDVEKLAMTGTRIYLGETDAGDVVGIDIDDETKARIDNHVNRPGASAEDYLDAPAQSIHVSDPVWFDLRTIALDLSVTDTGLATALVAVGNWHRTHTHSPRNGKPTMASAGGWVRTDTSTGSEHFPRTDPAVIMAVIHTDLDGTERILLGNNVMWPRGRYSLLAGFVEPGETLEAAVVREVREEAGVICEDPQYVGSQPWPFPCSLMLGFFARAQSREACADFDEMRTVRWFTRSELEQEIAAGTVSIPGQVSIAGQMLERWMSA